MMARRSIGMGSLAFAAALVGLAGFAANWRLSIRNAPKNGLPRELSQRIKEEYPLPSGQADAAAVPRETFAAFLTANPFSPERRRQPAVLDGPEGAGGPGQPNQPPAPKFIFKGRMLLGSRERAILEDVSAGKTYFLEVGQGVANFKVLDIDEKQVILSDPQTHEEVTVSLTSAAGP